jgi:hypothetical protein
MLEYFAYNTDVALLSMCLCALPVTQIKPFHSSKRDCNGGQTAICSKDQPCTPCEIDQVIVSSSSASSACVSSSLLNREVCSLLCRHLELRGVARAGQITR